MLLIRCFLSALDAEIRVSLSFCPANESTSASIGLSALGSITLFSTPMPDTSSSWSFMNSWMLLWANMSASTISGSGTSFAPPSTITIASFVPATTMFMSLSASSALVGLQINEPPTLPTLTAARGPSKGMSETMSAAEDAVSESTSGSKSASAENTVIMICV